MKRLSELVDVLSSLKKVSKQILKNMLPIMKELAIDNNYIVEEVSICSDAPIDVATEHLQATALNIISDAEIVKKEINAFAEIVELSQKDIKKNIQNYPFIAEVWFGDMFDGLEGIDALKKLLEDLKKDLAKTSDDWIIENAVDSLAKIYYKNKMKT